MERLVFERRLGEGGHILDADLLDYLRVHGPKPKDSRWLQTGVIAKLRDHGVLNTSSSAGYKLPIGPKGVTEFLAAAGLDAVKLVTRGEVDVLSAPEIAAVKRRLYVSSCREACD